ncbi:efflux transporter outer membrane subunit [Methylocucumis oryzae]|uniref:Multidrug transporter n=1 Tax=Methylocucumis oryzae TaxID=1632867 RepID=A0A0F3IG77_9GAMM|nr:efflux transporter outer membrane subunit [Methylocucumis oryzae]KJV05751.1 multidrug transporter [Methylocucumis oryzae]
MNKLCYVLSVFFISACTVGPDYQKPELTTPKHWQNLPATPMSHYQDAWWQSFHDPILNELISEASKANLDLKQALSRIQDARAQKASVFASALPSVSVNNSISKRLNSISGGGGANNSVGGGFGVGNQLINIFQNGFDAQWEIDLFGGVRRAAENAEALLDSEIENSRAIYVSLLAEVAKNYLVLRSNQQLQNITEANLKIQRETAALTKLREQSGLENSLNRLQAEAQIADTQAQLPIYQRDAQLTIHALSVLLGQEPNALTKKLSPVAAMPNVSTLMIPALPSELLQRRPDIRKAERQLAAANAAIGIATAELYPKVNLSAFIGLQNTRITDFTPLGKSWSTAAALSTPLFNWGKLSANIDSKEAQYQSQLHAYQTTVLTAFKEVEDALTAYRQQQLRAQALLTAENAHQTALTVAQERYQKGLTDYIDMLKSQEQLYQNQLEQIKSQAEQASQLIALYKALGGGWQTQPELDGVCKTCKKNVAETLHEYSKAVTQIRR